MFIWGFPWSFLLCPVRIMELSIMERKCIVGRVPVGTKEDGVNPLGFTLSKLAVILLQKVAVGVLPITGGVLATVLMKY